MASWFNNPFLFCMQRPMFWGNTGYYTFPSIRGEYQAKSAAFYATASLSPYSWFSNWGGGVQVNAYDPDMSLDTIMQLQCLQNNPYHIIRYNNPIDTAAQEQMLLEANNRGRIEGDKVRLKVKYIIVTDSTNAYLNEINALLQTEGLSDDNKTKLEALKAKVEALQQKIAQYAEASASKPVEEAIAEVEAMKGELLALKDEGKVLAQEIASTTPENPTDPTDPSDPTNPSDPSNPTQPADDVVAPNPPGAVQNPDAVADPDAVEDPILDENGKIKLDNEDLTLDDVRNTYNAYRPQLNEFLKTEGLSDADKQAIINKSKELVAAIKENKPPKDAAKLYNELIDLVKAAADNINNAANEAEANSNKEKVDKLKNMYTEELRPELNYLLNDPDISEKDKKAILDKSKALVAAFNANKPIEEVKKLYDEMIEVFAKASENTEKTRKTKAVQICSDLYTAANGFDWSWCGESANEKKIKDTVLNKITEYNVIDVLKQWKEGGYDEKTGQDCLLHTLYGEFEFNTSGIKTKLTNHILNCIKKAAAKLGILDDIQSSIAVITGELNCTCWSYEKIYNAFNEIIEILLAKKASGEQPAK